MGTSRQLERVFKYKDEVLPDVSGSMTELQIAKYYSDKHPALANATVEGPIIEDGKAVYTFTANLGTKG
jgi:PRTRC genetic system protein C